MKRSEHLNNDFLIFNYHFEFKAYFSCISTAFHLKIEHNKTMDFTKKCFQRTFYPDLGSFATKPFPAVF